MQARGSATDRAGRAKADGPDNLELMKETLKLKGKVRSRIAGIRRHQVARRSLSVAEGRWSRSSPVCRVGPPYSTGRETGRPTGLRQCEHRARV